MKKLGVVCTDWKFFENKYRALDEKYDIKVIDEIKPKTSISYINNLLYKYKLKKLIEWSEITYFEFANRPLSIVSKMDYSSKIIVRLHRYEIFSWADIIDWSKVDLVIFVADFMRNHFLEKFPFMKEKTIVLNNDVDTDRFNLINNNLNNSIGIAGSIIPRKRVYELILTLYELRKKIPPSIIKNKLSQIHHKFLLKSMN